jgi:cyclic-di-AMP phosphodiesterase PgpH
MLAPQPATNKKHEQRRSKIALLVVSAILAIVILNAPLSVRSGAYSVLAGDVAVQDISASRSFSYTSDILTSQARQQARNAISPVYLQADPTIKKQQLEKQKDIFDYITNIRNDSYATNEQKVADLGGITILNLSTDSRQKLISWNETRWQAIQQQARQVLDGSMRNTIRQDGLETIRHNLDSLVDVSFTQDQVDIIHELVAPLIVPNSLMSQDLTDKVKDEAEKAVEPVVRTFSVGQIIIQHGQIVKPEDVEALQKAGLSGQSSSLTNLLGSTAIVTVLAVMIGLYVSRRRAQPLDDLRNLVLISLLLNIFLVLVRFAIPYRAILPFIFPVAAFGLTLATAFNFEIGIIFSLVLSILSAFNLPGSLEITSYYALGGIIGILVLGRGRRISAFFWVSVAISCANLGVILAYRLGDPSTDWVGLITLTGAALTNGLASASLTLLLQYAFSQVMGITTAIQLLEISRPDHPLLQYLLRNAPGTYQHSLQVANLAEQAAEKINADSLLVRVGALYHDVGKALNPQFFIENQVKGKENPHDEIEPAVSAAIIINHVKDGVTLAKKFRMAPRIQDFISEHHGTMKTRYQYNRALEEANGDASKINENLYRYPGPIPNSRETALLMLADGCEARARAELPKNETELRLVVQKVIDYAMKEKQLDQTKLTMNDLSKISDSFVMTLMGVYHQRIIYPEATQPTEEDAVI